MTTNDTDSPVSAGEEALPLPPQWHAQQAVANARIEGFEPSPAFEADFAQVTDGSMTQEQYLARSLARAKEIEERNRSQRPQP